jgi:hypothetical protein
MKIATKSRRRALPSELMFYSGTIRQYIYLVTSGKRTYQVININNLFDIAHQDKRLLRYLIDYQNGAN